MDARETVAMSGGAAMIQFSAGASEVHSKNA
jgi:hypothetical protein